jgi:hypothetical protein
MYNLNSGSFRVFIIIGTVILICIFRFRLWFGKMSQGLVQYMHIHFHVLKSLKY